MTARIDLADTQCDEELDPGRLRALGAFLLDRLGLPGRLSLAFPPEEEVVRLNRSYFGRASTTDVMAFPLGEVALPAEEACGEVVVCAAQALRQAAEAGEPPERELLRLVIHGALHLAGWTDRTEPERAAMLARGEEILDAFLQESR